MNNTRIWQGFHQASLEDSQTRLRELRAIHEAKAQLKADRGTIVTWQDEGETEGVRIVPAWRCCLKPRIRMSFRLEQVRQTAFYFARWQNAKGDTGTWGLVLTMTVAG